MTLVELGGAAGILDIHDIRGVATGPLLRRFLGPVLRGEEEARVYPDVVDGGSCT